MNGREQFADKKTLVTGGLGFIGSNLAERLVGLGADVTIVDNLKPEFGGNRFNIREIEGRVNTCIADVRDVGVMRELLQGQDYCFNLAGQTSHLDSMHDPFTDMEINCQAQLSMREICRKHNPGIKTVFASTRQIYGKPDYLPVDEKHPVRPVDVNGINKMAGEWYHILYNNVYGVKACVLRLTNTYGPGMRIMDHRQMFMGIWVRRLIEGEAFDIFGDGKQVRDFNHVDDVVDAFLAAAADDRSNGEIYNLGSPERVSLRELADMLVEAGGAGRYNVIPFPPERKAIDIGDYYSDYDKIRRSLGWTPRVPLKKGLADTLAFYQKHYRRYLGNDQQ